MNKLETVVLDNGLTIYLYNDNRRHSTFFQINTYCGGITKHFIYNNIEYSLSDGIAHILEHYIVECNEKGNFLDKLGKMQMSTNAATSPYFTSYYFEGVENISYGINTMLEGIYNIKFSKRKLEKLKNPIKQEIRGKLDNKYYYIGKKRIENLFPNVDYRDVGGTLEEVQNATVDDLESLYKAFYHPKNQFIMIAGNFDRDVVLNDINKFFDKKAFEEYNTKVIEYPYTPLVNKKTDSFDFDVPKTYYEMAFKIDTRKYKKTELLDFDFYLASFLSSSFGLTSELRQNLIDEKVIVDSIMFSISPMKNCFIVTFGAFTDNIKMLNDAIISELKNLNHLDEEKFELDKKSAIINLILRDENIFSMIGPFINNVVFFDYPYLDEVEDVVRLSYDEYVKVIHDIDFSNYSCLTVNMKE